MASCERCWTASMGADGYHLELAEAERLGLECTKDTEEGARLRAGQWWDDVRKVDTRTTAQRTVPA